MNQRQLLSLLILFLTLPPMASSHAQALETRDWAIWNVTSATIFPEGSWLRYETPAEAMMSPQCANLIAAWKSPTRVG